MQADSTLLCVGGGVEAARGVARLRGLCPRLAVLDGNPEAPAFELADEALVVSTYDVEAAVAAARELAARVPVAGVLAVCADVPHTVAAIAEALGLPGLSCESAALAMDKLAMKQRFAQAGVPIPWFSEVESAAHLRQLVEQRSEALILKPVDSRGARGVVRMLPGVDPAWAHAEALENSPSGRVMVEAYLPGPQISSESMLLGGRSYTSGLSDRGYQDLESCAPFMIEDGGEQPSRFREQVLAEVDRVIEAAAAALGLVDGVLKGDLVLDEELRPVVIEVAPRLSGGYFCTDQIPASTGVDLVRAQARVAMGDPPQPEEVQPRSWRSTCVRYFRPPAGRFLAVHGLEELRQQEWVHHAALFVEPGDMLGSPTDHTGRAGMVMVTGASREQAAGRAAAALQSVEFEVRQEPASGGLEGPDPVIPSHSQEPSRSDSYAP